MTCEPGAAQRDADGTGRHDMRRVFGYQTQVRLVPSAQEFLGRGGGGGGGLDWFPLSPTHPYLQKPPRFK